MRVFNLTDVSTPTLVRHGLVNQQIVAHRRLVLPGEYVEVEDNSSMRARLAHLLTLGAVSVDQLPPAYLLAKQKAVPAAGAFNSVPVRHMSLPETKVVGTVSAPAPATEVAKPVILQKGKRKGRP